MTLLIAERSLDDVQRAGGDLSVGEIAAADPFDGADIIAGAKVAANYPA